MPKKYLYDMIELESLIQEQLKINHPDSEDVINHERMLTDDGRVALFLEILNRYGKEGWKLVSSAPIMVGREEPRRQFFIFEKDSYKKE